MIFDKLKIENTKEAKKRSFIVVLTLVCFLVISVLFFHFTNKVPDGGAVKVKITEIVSDEYFLTKGYAGDDVLKREIIFNAKILEGERKGEIVKTYFSLDEMSQLSSYDLKVGDKMFAEIFEEEQEGVSAFASEFVRDDFVFILGAIFIASLLVFGKSQGAKTALSLAISCVFVFFFFIPLLLKGFSPVALSFFTSAIIIILTLYLVIGRNEKSICAAVGCIGGLLCAFILAFVMQKLMHLTGLVTEESALLMVHSPNGYINLKGIVLAQVIIGALGATMDVAVSVSSSLSEIKLKSPEILPRSLLSSGITIGRDIMGTMANTLILAYVGSSLQSILLIYTSQMGFRTAINREIIAGEILQSICGSMGLLLTIPITAVVSTILYERTKRKNLSVKLEEQK